MRLLPLLGGLGLAACQRDPVALPGGRGHDLGPTGKRPLCKEERTAPGAKFAQDLRDWADLVTASDNRYYGEDTWQLLEAQGEAFGADPAIECGARLVRGWDRLRFGDLDGAIHDLTIAESLMLTDPDGAAPLERARQLLGATYMRQAETVNCVDNGSGESCIVPFGEHAVHIDPTIVANAGAAFERALEANPDQPSVVWLDNVTYMARGTWPQDVPVDYQLPDTFLASEEDAPAWTNVMAALGITEPTLAGGAAVEDFDGDGRLDLMVSTIDPRDGMDLYLNEGDGGFCQASNASGVSSIPGILSFSVADYDNDGDMDVFAPRGGWLGAEGTIRPSLLRNDGDGRFTDVAVAAGLDDPYANGPSQVAAWGDVNNDGWLDVFVGRESDEDGVRRVSSLYVSNGDGTFVDVAEEAGLAHIGFVKGANWLDYDRDGDIDLYVSLFTSDNAFFENRGELTFVDRGIQLGLTLPDRAFSVAPLDYDQDGRQDLFVAAFTNNYAGGGPLDPTYFRSAESWVLDQMGLPPNPDALSETARLFHNTEEGWVDVTAELGLDDIHSTMGMSFGDIDADSYPDLILATGAPEYDALEPNVAYHNVAGTAFLDVTPTIGMGSIQKGHGVSFGDVDEDGDQDLLQEIGGAFLSDVAPNQLFVNPTNEGAHVHRHTVILRLEGVTVARSALHARVHLVTALGEAWQVVGESGSFGNASLQLEFGLGDADAVERVEIDWPGAETEVVEDVPVDRIVWITQGEGVVRSRPYEPLVLDGAAGSHIHADAIPK